MNIVLAVVGYEALRSQREQLQFHSDWALSSGEKASAISLAKERDSIDQDLLELKSQYERIKAGKAKRI